jgi:hypothetical protein
MGMQLTCAKFMLGFLLCLIAAGSAAAQTTTVTGTITDLNSNPYANGTASAFLILPTGAPIPVGAILSTTVPTNTLGFFSFSGTTALASPQTYIFTMCAMPVNIGPTTNLIPKQVCFTSPAILISGASQDVSSTLNTVAAQLGPFKAASNITIGVNQVGFGAASNNVVGSPNFQWNAPVANALNLNMPGASCVGQGTNQHGCTLLVLTNSSASTPFYINKFNDNSICFTNDDATIPNHGLICMQSNGTLAMLSGAAGSQMQLSTTITTQSGWTFPAGSVLFALPDSGIGQAQFALGVPGSGAVARIWDTGTGCDTLYPGGSAVIKTTWCPPASGTSTVETTLNSNSTALNTGALGGAGCEATITVAAANVTTSSRIVWNYATDPSAVAGYGAAPIDAIHLLVWPTTGNVNFKQCSSVAVTPGAINVLWNALN